MPTCSLINIAARPLGQLQSTFASTTCKPCCRSAAPTSNRQLSIAVCATREDKVHELTILQAVSRRHTVQFLSGIAVSLIAGGTSTAAHAAPWDRPTSNTPSVVPQPSAQPAARSASSAPPPADLSPAARQAVDEQRRKAGFYRAYDGKVAFLRPSDGVWLDVKCDMRVPGTLLLRDPAEGQLYYVSLASLLQVDLSDDDVVAGIAMAGWEEDALPLSAQDEDGEVARVLLDRDQFYGVITVLEGVEELVEAQLRQQMQQ